MGYANQIVNLCYMVDHKPNAKESENWFRSVESVMNNIKFYWENYPPGKYKFRQIEDRLSWLERAVLSDGDWAIYADNCGNEGGGYSWISYWNLHRMDMTLFGIINSPQLDDLFTIAGDSIRAIRSSFMPADSDGILIASKHPTGGMSGPAVEQNNRDYPYLRRIPRLRQRPEGQIPVSWLFEPDEIGWLNYWCNETALRMGLNESLREQLPFYKIVKTEFGWYFRLTEEVFDIRRAEHGEILLGAYEIFSKIGVRDAFQG